MGELIQKLEEIKQLPPQLHLFCPRQSDDDYDRYEYNGSVAEHGDRPAASPEILQRMQGATKRRAKFIDAMGLIAFDGVHTEPYKNYIWERLNDALSKCDLCIPAYYVAKLEMRESLLQQFLEDDVKSFFDIIDNVDIERIVRGLDQAKTTLRNVPDQKRNLSLLDQASLFAIFEALSCEAFLQREELLRNHFDEPFTLIQGKRPLKTRDYVPAATRFLFDTQFQRFRWASAAWVRFDRPPTEVEWNWTVKEVLQKRFTQSYEERSPASVSRLWNGLRFLVGRLDQQQITHNLRALEPDVSKMALDHFAIKTAGLRYILQTIKLVLEKAPTDFWDAMGSISPATVIEQIFGSPFYEKLLQDTTRHDSESERVAVQMISWIPALQSSLKAANQPPACRALAAQLFRRAQRMDLSADARSISHSAGLNALLLVLRQFANSPELRQSMGRFVLCDMLEIVSQHIATVVGKNPESSSVVDELKDIKLPSMEIVRHSLDSDCQTLKNDFLALSVGETLQQGSSGYSSNTWSVVVEHLHTDDTKLSEAALRGTVALPGLERLVSKRTKDMSQDATKYNMTFDMITGLLKQVLERISDFAPEHLDYLFKTQETSMPLIAALFSADQGTYMAANDLVKNVSGQAGQKEALIHLLRAFLSTTLFSLSWVFRRVASMRTFASIPRMLKTGMDILDILTDTQTGLLRMTELQPRDIRAAQAYWMYQWQALRTVFKETERWHTLYHDKALMTEVCRDAMQFAEALFEQYDVFASAILSTKSDFTEDVDKLLLENSNGSPASTLQAMSKWLRLRDEYLSATLVKLITKMLRRLHDHESKIPADGLAYIEEVAVRNTVKTLLSAQQKAEVVRSLEIYHGRPIIVEEPLKKQKSLVEWTKTIRRQEKPDRGSSREQSVDDFGDSEVADKDLYELSKPIEQSIARFPHISKTNGATKLELVKPIGVKPKKPVVQKSKQEVSAFLETRRRETEARKARDREAAAQLRGKMGIGEQTKAQGSGVNSIGVKGKDHAVSGEGMMVSSDSDSDSEDEMDKQLFGSKVEKVKQSGNGVFSGLAKTGAQITRGPVKKTKRLLHRNDMRARLAPDLSGLHQTILGWDFFADTELPPNSSKEDYTLVSNSFATILDYQNTFEPLLVLEGWQSFRSAREDGSFKPFEIKVSNRLSVDSSVEVSTTMSIAEGRELGLGTADVVLLSRDSQPHNAPGQPHCLARVKEKTVKQGRVEIVLRVNSAGNALLSVLAPGTSIWGVQLMSLTPLEREYGALKALAFYDLGEEIIRAKPSPMLDYADRQLQPIVQNYSVNLAQAKAIRSALDNDAFTLVQGPPGSGKTKTICALVGAMMTESLRSQSTVVSRPSTSINGASASGSVASPVAKKVLVCAPSNAAVDELVMRFKEGIKTSDGRHEKLSIVRLGRSDAINANVRDVTLEELVNARLNLAAPKQGNDRDIHSVMMEHKETSNELHAVRMRIDGQRAKGELVPPADTQAFEGLKKKKAQLSVQIDSARDKQKTASRDAELERRRIQQSILDSAQVLCATLSGSGHEIFQSLNIEFETVIIDEAAQSIELSALIPLKYGCSKCILVGDPKQLPPTVLSREAARYQFEQSLFARMEKNHAKDVHLLDTQYRMHPEISAFPSKTFYDSRLKDGADMAKLRARPWHHASLLGPTGFLMSQGCNQLYDRLVTDCRQYDFKGRVGIITPYKGQLRELRARFSRRYGEGILSAVDFNTTDAFQGRESEVIIFSCVRATTKGIGFLSDIRRMNVGLTRAKSSLWVLGDSKTLVKGEFWRGLVTDAQARNLYTDGDVSRLLSKPLLTMDMMREDVEMGGVLPAVQGSSSHPPISIPAESPRNSTKGVQAIVPASSNQLSKVSKNAVEQQQASSTAPTTRQEESKTLAVGSSPKQIQGSPAPARSSRIKDTVWRGLQVARLASTTLPNVASVGRTTTSPMLVQMPLREQRPMAYACVATALFIHCMIAQKSAASNVARLAMVKKTAQRLPYLRLGRAEKEHVRKQEQDFLGEKARARQRRAARQLGEHGAKIPTVRSTLSDHVKGQKPATLNPLSTGGSVEGKRKRENISPVDAPRDAKALRAGTGGLDLTGHIDPQMQGGGPMQGQRIENPPSSQGTNRSGPPGGVIVRRKAKESDLFLKRK